MNPQLLFIAGLAGAGKSTMIKTLFSQRFIVFDDFMAKAVDDRPEFSHCRYLKEIEQALRNGESVVMADVRLCEPRFRQAMLTTLQEWSPSHEIVWHCFEPDLKACDENIRYRAATTPRDNVKTEGVTNKTLASHWVLPQGAIIHQVTQARKKMKMNQRIQSNLDALLLNFKRFV